MKLDKIIMSIATYSYLQYARIRMNKYRNIKNPAMDKIVNSISDVLNNRLSCEELLWVRKIEEKRKELINSSNKISITEFGVMKQREFSKEKKIPHGFITNRTVSEICQTSSKPYFWTLILFKLIREFKPSNIIELGTCLGISGAYLASALKINNYGQLVTLEGAKSLASIAEMNFQQLGLDNAHVVIGLFQDNLDRVLNQNKPVDFVFIDGHHDEIATLSYFRIILPFLSSKSVIVFDDIYWSDGMLRAWKKIIKNEVVKISLNLRKIGICVLDKSIEKKYKYRFPLFSSLAKYN